MPTAGGVDAKRQLRVHEERVVVLWKTHTHTHKGLSVRAGQLIGCRIRSKVKDHLGRGGHGAGSWTGPWTSAQRQPAPWLGRDL